MAKKNLTLKEHLETADDLAIAAHHLLKAFSRCNKIFPKSGKLIKELNKMIPGNSSGILSKVQNELDIEYHKIADDKIFEEHGHIYYRLDDRFKAIKK